MQLRGFNMSETPNPGSAEATDMGCECPVIDNAHGLGANCNPGEFWINATCPIHGVSTQEQA